MMGQENCFEKEVTTAMTYKQIGAILKSFKSCNGSKTIDIFVKILKQIRNIIMNTKKYIIKIIVLQNG